MIPTVSYSTAARALLRDDHLIVLAIETIGGQLSAVALLDRHETVLLATSIRPIRSIPALAVAPPLERVWPILAALLINRIVVSREIVADHGVLQRAARRLGATLMYADWRSVGASACHSTPRPPMLSPTRVVLTEARVTLAALRALTVPPTPMQPPRRVFWRYL